MGNSESITRKVSFEDVQFIINNSNQKYLLINTMSENLQNCLISGTINYKNEEKIINDNVNNKNIHIILYDKNSNENKLIHKYQQLIQLGFINVFIYPGGLFEWLLLQDVYGEDNFPTTSKELHILKYKSERKLNMFLLKN